MYCFVILLLFNEMQMSVRRFSAIPHLRELQPETPHEKPLAPRVFDIRHED